MGKKKLSKEEFIRRRKRQKNALIAGMILACIFMIVVVIMLVKAVIGVFTGEADKKESAVVTKLQSKMSVTDMLLTAGSKVRPGQELEGVKYVIIHYSGSMGMDAKDKRDLYESLIKDSSAAAESMHYIVGLNGGIVRCIPEGESALASGARNNDSISIEYCYTDEAGTCEGDTYESMVNLTAYLLAKYNLTTENVKMHYDINGTMCPPYFAGNTDNWSNFLKDVRGALSNASN